MLTKEYFSTNKLIQIKHQKIIRRFFLVLNNSHDTWHGNHKKEKKKKSVEAKGRGNKTINANANKNFQFFQKNDLNLSFTFHALIKKVELHKMAGA